MKNARMKESSDINQNAQTTLGYKTSWIHTNEWKRFGPKILTQLFIFHPNEVTSYV